MAYFDSILPKTTGTEILSTANKFADESANASARDARSARIAELENELAEIRKQRASLDTEAEMTKYKFQYDADPSAYTTLMQNRRTAEQTEKIRKATEDATKLSNLQSQWKQNGIDMEVNKFDLASAQNEFNTAKGNNDKTAMETALLRIKQAQAKENRLKRENDILRTKLFKDLNVGDVKDTTDYSAYDNAIAGADDVTKLLGDVAATKKSITVDNVRIPKTQKTQFVTDMTKKLDYLESEIKSSPLSVAQKEKQLAEITESRKALNDYGKSVDNGGQPTEPTKEDYAKKILLNGSLRNQTALVALGEKTLKAAKEFFPEYAEQLDAAIEEAVMSKKK